MEIEIGAMPQESLLIVNVDKTDFFAFNVVDVTYLKEEELLCLKRELCNYATTFVLQREYLLHLVSLKIVEPIDDDEELAQYITKIHLKAAEFWHDYMIGMSN